MENADHARLTLRNIKWTAEAQAITLARALQAFAQGTFEESGASGRQIVGTAANGHSVTFQLAPGVPATYFPELAERLLTCHEESTAVLVASGVSAPTDAQVFAEMLARLKPVRSYFVDFSSIRQPLEVCP